MLQERHRLFSRQQSPVHSRLLPFLDHRFSFLNFQSFVSVKPVGDGLILFDPRAP